MLGSNKSLEQREQALEEPGQGCWLGHHQDSGGWAGDTLVGKAKAKRASFAP